MREDTALRVAGNTAAYIFGNLFSRIFDIVTIFILARYLGVLNFGKFSFAFAYVGLFFVLTDWGVNSILVRETSRAEGRESLLFGSGISLKFGLSLLAIAVVGASLMVLREPGDVKLLVAIVSFNLLVSFRLPSFKDVFEVPLISRLKLRLSAYAAIANRMLTFVGIILAVRFHAPLWVVTLVYSLTALPAFFLLISFSRREAKPSFRIKLKEWKFLLKEGFPIGLSGIFFILVFQFDMLLLSRFWTKAEIGLYSASRRMTEPLELIPTALFFSILPIVSRLNVQDKARLARIYSRALLMMAVAAGFLTGVLSLCAEPLIILLFGTDYRGAAGSLIVLGFYLPFIFIWHVCGSIFIALNKQRFSSWIWFTALLLNIILNLIFIPRYAYVGASLARLGTGMIVAVLGMMCARRLVGPISLGFLFKIGVLAVIPVAVLKFVLPLPAWLAVVLFCAVFGLGLFVLNVLNREELLFFSHQLWSRRRPSEHP